VDWWLVDWWLVDWWLVAGGWWTGDGKPAPLKVGFHARKTWLDAVGVQSDERRNAVVPTAVVIRRAGPFHAA
jgi:hypothetical protein